MRILIFEQRYTSPHEAGIGRFHTFAREWIAGGHEVTVIAGQVNYLSGDRTESPRSEEHEVTGLTLIRVRDSFPGYRTFLGRMASYGLFFLFAFVRGCTVSRPDVVIASSPPLSAGLLGYLVARVREAPFVFEVRDLWPDVAVELGFVKNRLVIAFAHRIERFLYSKAARIVVNSPGLQKFLSQEKGVHGEMITVVENPLTPFRSEKEARPSLREVHEWGDKTVVLYAGALSAVYDFDLLFDAARTLEEEPFVFAIVGDGRQRAAFEARCVAEGLTNVKFFGSQPKMKIPSFIEVADVCIAPLKRMRLLKYVYATKLVDYMMGGKPTVLAMGGVSEKLLCNEAHAGLCVPPENADSFVCALRTLASDAPRREALGRAGRTYVLTHFNGVSLAARYLAALPKPAVVPKR